MSAGVMLVVSKIVSTRNIVAVRSAPESGRILADLFERDHDKEKDKAQTQEATPT